MKKQRKVSGRKSIDKGELQVSCRDLGKADHEGWLSKKAGGHGIIPISWKRYWCVLKDAKFYCYKTSFDSVADYILLVKDYTIENVTEKKKIAFCMKPISDGLKSAIFGANTREEVKQWVDNLNKILSGIDVSQADDKNVPDYEERKRVFSSTEKESPKANRKRHSSAFQKETETTGLPTSFSSRTTSLSSPRPRYGSVGGKGETVLAVGSMFKSLDEPEENGTSENIEDTADILYKEGVPTIVVEEEKKGKNEPTLDALLKEVEQLKTGAYHSQSQSSEPKENGDVHISDVSNASDASEIDNPPLSSVTVHSPDLSASDEVFGASLSPGVVSSEESKSTIEKPLDVISDHSGPLPLKSPNEIFYTGEEEINNNIPVVTDDTQVEGQTNVVLPDIVSDTETGGKTVNESLPEVNISAEVMADVDAVKNEEISENPSSVTCVVVDVTDEIENSEIEDAVLAIVKAVDEEEDNMDADDEAKGDEVVGEKSLSINVTSNNEGVTEIGSSEVVIDANATFSVKEAVDEQNVSSGMNEVPNEALSDGVSSEVVSDDASTEVALVDIPTAVVSNDVPKDVDGVVIDTGSDVAATEAVSDHVAAEAVSDGVATEALPDSVAVETVSVCVVTEAVSGDVASEDASAGIPIEVVSDGASTESVSHEVSSIVVSDDVPSKVISDVPPEVVSEDVPSKVVSDVPSEVVSEDVPSKVVSNDVPSDVVSDDVPTADVLKGATTELVSDGISSEVVSENVASESVPDDIPVSDDVIVKVDPDMVSTEVVSDEVTSEVVSDDVSVQLTVDNTVNDAGDNSKVTELASEAVEKSLMEAVLEVSINTSPTADESILDAVMKVSTTSDENLELSNEQSSCDVTIIDKSDQSTDSCSDSTDTTVSVGSPIEVASQESDVHEQTTKPVEETKECKDDVIENGVTQGAEVVCNGNPSQDEIVSNGDSSKVDTICNGGPEKSESSCNGDVEKSDLVINSCNGNIPKADKTINTCNGNIPQAEHVETKCTPPISNSSNQESDKPLEKSLIEYI